MNREIKFRVWHERYREFKYWGFLDSVFIGIPTGSQISIEDCKHLSQQFTGLKDKNGKEIYEGDLMAIDDEKGEHKFTYTVVFEDAKFVCYHVIKEYGKWGDLCRAFDADFAPYNFHVIGNIYENPELLKP